MKIWNLGFAASRKISFVRLDCGYPPDKALVVMLPCTCGEEADDDDSLPPVMVSQLKEMIPVCFLFFPFFRGKQAM